MRYYLSYIERNDHAGLMLSEQSFDSEPPKVICELGFALSLDVVEADYFGTYKGRVGEESNASRALYSSRSDVKHRTYEISRAEMNNFFLIINKDRRINSDKIDPTTRIIKYEGGPDYQKLRHNCKSYALGIFKKLGIIEAEALSNFFIQRPRTHRKLLQPLSGAVLCCPIKEKLEEITASLLARIECEIESINSKDDRISKETRTAIQEIISLSSELLKNKKKLGIQASLNNNFRTLSQLLNSIASDVLTSFNEELAEVEKMANEVTQLSEKGILSIYWKPNFHVSKRLKFDSFTPEEKAMYTTKIKTNEMSDGLAQILSDIEKRMRHKKSFERDLYLDLVELMAMVKEAKQEIDGNKQEFLKISNKLDSTELIKACMTQRRLLAQITKKLEKSLDHFKPRTEDGSAFKRLINRIISYFKKDFTTVDTIHTLIRSGIHSLKKSTQIINMDDVVPQCKK